MVVREKKVINFKIIYDVNVFFLYWLYILFCFNVAKTINKENATNTIIQNCFYWIQTIGDVCIRFWYFYYIYNTYNWSTSICPRYMLVRRICLVINVTLL